MSGPAPAGGRFTSLDVIRGIAVMGILLANLPAFALPMPAYFSPLAWGGTGPAEIAAWFANFVFVEGRMRGLFSFLFGASMLLVIDRARESRSSAAAAHYSRMAVLFLLGLAHLYLIWWGDILAHYALVGAVAFAFARLSTRVLVQLGLLLLLASILWSMMGWLALLSSAARDTPQAIATWSEFERGFGRPPASSLAPEIAAMRGDWLDSVRWRLQQSDSPLTTLEHLGAQTLSAMLLGMAAFRSGFLTGEWERARYRRWALVSLGIALPAYAALGLLTLSRDFDQRFVFLGAIVASQPFRTIGVVGYAALAMLLIRPGGWLTARLAAVGRTAFSNYIGTSILMTAIFYGWGLGLFASVPRAAIYVFAPLAWLLMLAWSQPWLRRFHYGPLEWLWRSLARLEVQPLRRAA